MAKNSSKADMRPCTLETVDMESLPDGEMRIDPYGMHLVTPAKLPNKPLIICENDDVTGIWTIDSGPVKVGNSFQYTLQKKPVAEMQSA